MLAEKINNREIKIKEDRYKSVLTEELEQVKEKDWDKDMVKKLVPKNEIRENIGRSPDYSDSMMMRMYFELVGADRSDFFAKLKKARKERRDSKISNNNRQTSY